MSSFEFRFKKIAAASNYVLEEINYRDLMSEKYKKTSKYLNHVQHLIVLASTIASFVSISAFALLVFILVGISAVEKKKLGNCCRNQKI